MHEGRSSLSQDSNKFFYISPIIIPHFAETFKYPYNSHLFLPAWKRFLIFLFYAPHTWTSMHTSAQILPLGVLTQEKISCDIYSYSVPHIFRIHEAMWDFEKETAKCPFNLCMRSYEWKTLWLRIYEKKLIYYMPILHNMFWIDDLIIQVSIIGDDYPVDTAISQRRLMLL